MWSAPVNPPNEKHFGIFAEAIESRIHVTRFSKKNLQVFLVGDAKSEIEKNRGDKGGFISSNGIGFRSGSSLGLSTDFDSFSTKPKGHQPSATTAPPKVLGMQLGKSQRTNQFLESLKAEGEVILEDVQPRANQSRAAAAPLTEPVTLSVEEKLNVTLKRDGGVSNFDVQGTLSLQILNQDDGHIQVQIETGENPGVLFKTHSNMNKKLSSNENILGARDPNRPFLASQGGGGVGLLKWRMQSTDESMVLLMSGLKCSHYFGF